MSGEIREDVSVDLADEHRRPVIVNVAEGGTATVNVSVRNYQYPEWLDQLVQEHIKWEG